MQLQYHGCTVDCSTISTLTFSTSTTSTVKSSRSRVLRRRFETTLRPNTKQFNCTPAVTCSLHSLSLLRRRAKHIIRLFSPSPGLSVSAAKCSIFRHPISRFSRLDFQNFAIFRVSHLYIFLWISKKHPHTQNIYEPVCQLVCWKSPSERGKMQLLSVLLAVYFNYHKSLGEVQSSLSCC